LGNVKKIEERGIVGMSGNPSRHRIAKIVVFLIVVAFGAGAVACDGSGNGSTHQLIISSTQGGSVIAPGEGVFTYQTGAVVELVAAPDDGYRFYRWAGDTEQIADPSRAMTTITMNGDYSIMASFVPGGSTPPGGDTKPSVP